MTAAQFKEYVEGLNFRGGMGSRFRVNKVTVVHNAETNWTVVLELKGPVGLMVMAQMAEKVEEFFGDVMFTATVANSENDWLAVRVEGNCAMY